MNRSTVAALVVALMLGSGVAGYLIFLAEETGLVPANRCAGARKLLDRYESYQAMIDDISR